MARINTYDIRTPQGAGEGYKVDRVPAPPIGGTCFQNMQSVADLPINPSAEDASLARLRRKGILRSEGQSAPRRVTVKAHSFGFSKGATVKDVKTGRKGIIIKANAGYTKRSHTPVHTICDENGDTWLAKEKYLKLKH